MVKNYFTYFLIVITSIILATSEIRSIIPHAETNILAVNGLNNITTPMINVNIARISVTIHLSVEFFIFNANWIDVMLLNIIQAPMINAKNPSTTPGLNMNKSPTSKRIIPIASSKLNIFSSWGVEKYDTV